MKCRCGHPEDEHYKGKDCSMCTCVAFRTEMTRIEKLEAQLAWQKEMLARAKRFITIFAEVPTAHGRRPNSEDDWLADLERGMPAGDGEK